MASWSLKFNLSISHAPFSQRYYSTRVTNIIKKTGRKISIFHRSSQKLNQRVISKSTFPLIAKVIRLNQSANPFPPLNRSLLFRCIEQSLSFISIRILPPLEYFHPIVDSLSMICLSADSTTPVNWQRDLLREPARFVSSTAR